MENILEHPYTRTKLIQTTVNNFPVSLTRRLVPTLTRYGSTRKCLVTTSTPHGYVAGTRVYFTFCEDDWAIERGFLVATIISPTTFLIFADGTSPEVTGGDCICWADIFVRQATVIGMKDDVTNNADNVWIGPNSVNGGPSYVVFPGLEIYLNGDMPDETRVNLGSYYIDPVVSNDGVVVLYS